MNSLNIAREHVTHVLLADGWHQVAPNSFDIADFEFVEIGETMDHAITDAVAGFEFYEGPDVIVRGPLSSILALRCSPSH